MADALLVTLALATSPYKPVVLGPGTDTPDSLPADDLVATISSPGRFTGARSSQAAVEIVLGPSAEDEARELLESGKVLHAEGKDGAAAAGEPSDVVLSIVSDGQTLQFTNQVRPFVRLLSVAPLRKLISPPAEPDGFVGLVGVALPRLAASDQTDPQRLGLVVPPPFDPVRIRSRALLDRPLGRTRVPDSVRRQRNQPGRARPAP